jgi:putative glutathione S-transferase
MGMMIDGQWRTDDAANELRNNSIEGAFRRPDSTVRDGIEDGEPGRYRLIVMQGCPWAHRAHIVWSLEGLAGIVSLVKTAQRMTENGWVFDDDHPDPEGREALHAYYAEGVDGYTGRVTVPVLWDERERRMVNNESADIIRILDRAFDAHLDAPVDLVPDQLREEIDELNAWIYPTLNNGVYRAGFATSEEAHQKAKADVFATLGALEQRLADGHRTYLVGEQLTEADVRLFTTLARFPAYFHAFRCNERPLTDYPALWAYAKRIASIPAVAETLLDPMSYLMGYKSIPFAVGHRDPLPDVQLPALVDEQPGRRATGSTSNRVDK